MSLNNKIITTIMSRTTACETNRFAALKPTTPVRPHVTAFVLLGLKYLSGFYSLYHIVISFDSFKS